jgi:hypothetical protein
MASSMTVTKINDPNQDHSPLVVKLACTAHTDGTFTSKQLIAAEVGGFNYWQYGLYIYEAWTINDHTTYPGQGEVTITDEQGIQILKTTELVLSTSADGIVEAAIGKTRLISSKITIAVSDTGNAANKFDLYLKFVR